MILVAAPPHQLQDLADIESELRRHGHEADLLDAAAMRAVIDSPTYLGGLHQRTEIGLCDPAELARILADIAE